jgi:PhnB protein
MPTMPYLHFQGHCAAALAHYQEVFGGTDLQMLRYADGPEAPDAWKSSDRIMHGQLTLFDGTLMASDYPPGVDGEAQKGVSVMQTAPDVATGRRIFDRLAAEGRVIEPYGATFFSPGFGMVKDRFGTTWIISSLPAEAQAQE